MNTAEKIEVESTELVVKESINPLQVFTDDGIDPVLKQIEERVSSHVPDVSTAKGRKDIASIAYKVRQSKTMLDGLGKDLVSDWKEKAKKVDASRKKARDYLDALAEKVRQPLTEWEQTEENRVNAHKNALAELSALAIVVDVSGTPLDSIQLNALLLDAEQVKMGSHWEEFAAQAAELKDEVITKLKAAIAHQEKLEAERAELEKLRREEEERKRREYEEKLRREAAEQAKREAEEAAALAAKEAEERAERERMESARREAEAREAAERAERERLQAIEQARIEKEQAIAEEQRKAKAEAERIEKERLDREAKAKAEAERKAANEKHRAKIHNAALACFVKNGFSESDAKQIVTLIAKGEIKNVQINY